jgi:CBS domain-containing protein
MPWNIPLMPFNKGGAAPVDPGQPGGRANRHPVPSAVAEETFMRAIDIGTRRVIQAGDSATVAEAAGIMRRHQAGCLVVTREQDDRVESVGIVTDRDLVTRCIAAHFDPATTPLECVMSAPLLCCRPDAPIDEIVDTMQQRGVRRLPLIDTAGTLVGIVSTDDVLAALAELADRVNQTLNAQPMLDRAYL